MIIELLEVKSYSFSPRCLYGEIFDQDCRRALANLLFLYPDALRAVLTSITLVGTAIFLL
jgi:hypothetical protein